MFNERNESLFYSAWLRLIAAYLVSFALSFAFGIFLTKIVQVAPKTVFALSTKRLAHIAPIFETSTELGIDLGIILFAWNVLAALVTISFLYSAQLFDPHNASRFPHGIRRAFIGRNKMKILCYLPGCMRIQDEPVRRLYIWLMVPWLGLVLLGIESGLTVSTSSYTLGSYFIGFISLIPHGIIEIPAFALAGAVPFTAHLLIKKKTANNLTTTIFTDIREYRDEVPLPNIITLIISCLFLAGLVEGNITKGLVDTLLK